MAELNTDYGIDLLGRVSKGMELRNILLRNAMAEKQMGTFEEERNWLKESRGREKTKEEQSISTGKLNLENLQAINPVIRVDSFKKYLADVAPSISWQSYAQGGREHLLETAKGLGVDKIFSQVLPPPDEITKNALANNQTPEQFFNTQRDKISTTFAEQTARITAEAHKTTAEKTVAVKWSAPVKGVDAEGNDIYFQTDESGAARILQGVKPPDTPEKWSAPQTGVDNKGQPIVYQVDAKGQKRVIEGVRPDAKKGLRVYDSNGNLIVDTTGGEMTPKVKSDIQTKITNGSEQLARIQAIAADFKPEYQEIGTRLGAAWTGVRARLGEGISKEDEQQLTGFKKFQRKSIENINLYIKEITGAQMSEKEADRLRLAQPDPGEKWYKGDDPITFKAKMDDVTKYTRAAIARYQYYLSRGFSEDKIKKMINDGSAESLEGLVEKMK